LTEFVVFRRAVSGVKVGAGSKWLDVALGSLWKEGGSRAKRLLYITQA